MRLRYLHIAFMVAAMMSLLPVSVSAQEEDTIHVADIEAPMLEQVSLPAKPRRDWTSWKPSAKRAMWLALVAPGAGQMYNRKFWKLPLVYGGFVGCIYAYSWNNMMYQDYTRAYMDIMDDDDSTHSYDQFLHLGMQIDSSNLSRYQDLFKKRKDRFRRYRDLSLFCIIGVYALSVIDAYVDASLSEFDISDDLTLHIEPAIISNQRSHNPFESAALGVQCSLTF